MDALSHKSRIFVAGMLVVVDLLLVAVLISAAHSSTARAAVNRSSATAFSVDVSGSPNVVTGGMAAAVDGVGQATLTAENAVNSAARSFTAATTHMATITATSGKLVARGIGNGLGLVARAVGSSFIFVFRIPGHIFGAMTNTDALGAVVKPAEHTQVPVIDPYAAVLAAAKSAQPAPSASGHVVLPPSSGAMWPIHGVVTTLFGVPEWPYEPIHTGMDISDGKAPGITAIHPFKAGRVVETIHSHLGLGNHVVIDHGGGMTSVYGHLASISVHVGQIVNHGTVVGLEGTTGVSTGTHLHFEIRINGKPINPQLYISGQP